MQQYARHTRFRGMDLDELFPLGLAGPGKQVLHNWLGCSLVVEIEVLDPEVVVLRGTKDRAAIQLTAAV